jgi:hypothetical protein
MAKMPIAHLASEVLFVVVLSRSWGRPDRVEIREEPRPGLATPSVLEMAVKQTSNEGTVIATLNIRWSRVN